MPSEKQMITKAVSDLKELQKMMHRHNYDKGDAHQEADNVLLRFVPQEVKEAWEKVDKWYA